MNNKFDLFHFVKPSEKIRALKKYINFSGLFCGVECANTNFKPSIITYVSSVLAFTSPCFIIYTAFVYSGNIFLQLQAIGLLGFVISVSSQL